MYIIKTTSDKLGGVEIAKCFRYHKCMVANLIIRLMGNEMKYSYISVGRTPVPWICQTFM